MSPINTALKRRQPTRSPSRMADSTVSSSSSTKKIEIASAIGNDFSDAGDADLVVLLVEVTEFDARVGGDLGRLVIGAKVGDPDRVVAAAIPPA